MSTQSPGTSVSPPSFVSPAILLRVYSVPSSRSLMNREKCLNRCTAKSYNPIWWLIFQEMFSSRYFKAEVITENFRHRAFHHRFGICGPVEHRCMTRLTVTLRHGKLLTVVLLIKSPTKICLYQKRFSTKWTHSLKVFSGIFYLSWSKSTSEYHSFFLSVIWALTTWLKYNALPLPWYFKNYSVYLLLYNLNSLFALHHSL